MQLNKKKYFFCENNTDQATFSENALSMINVNRKTEMNFWNDRQGTGRRMYTGRPEMPAIAVGQIFQENHGTVFAVLSKSRRS